MLMTLRTKGVKQATKGLRCKNAFVEEHGSACIYADRSLSCNPQSQSHAQGFYFTADSLASVQQLQQRKLSLEQSGNGDWLII